MKTDSGGDSEHTIPPASGGIVQAIPAARAQPEAPAKSRLRTPLVIVAALMAVAAAVAATSRLIDAASPAVALPVEGRVALLPFLDRSEPAGGWVEIGLMEMVAEAVARTAGPAVVSPEYLSRALAPRELDLDQPGSRERARRLALAAGASQVIDAVVLRQGDDAAIELALYDASGRVAESRVRGEDALDAADALAFALARALESGAEPRRLSQLFARSPFLDRLYAMGVQALREVGPDSARRHFDIALEQRPDFVLAKARLAECERLSGNLERSAELTGEVLLAAQTRAERRLEAYSLRHLALLSALEGELDRASELYSQAFAIHLDMGDPAARAEVLYELARLALVNGDATRAEELYVDMLGIQNTLGDRLGEADTLFQIGSLLLSGGDLDGAARVLGDARELTLATGDVWTEMRVVASLGEVEHRRGQIDAAKDLWSRALVFYDQRGSDPRRLLLSYKLAEAQVRTGELKAAEDRFHDLRELAIELGDRPYEARASVSLAWLMLRGGYPYQAKPHLDRALELDRFLDDRVLLQVVIAWFAYEQGNYRLAVQTQLDVKRRAAAIWAPVDEQFLAVYRQAEVLGHRLPLPGEDDYEDLAAG